ncbi:hypothetical protein [Phenylobacterium sp.]|uniref:hypothetical protein n=1 Tax=Phenylobacterium sp. TaxID=1871053 RepID=UPI0025E2F350|nr:hypothetical protein [Phenylobacterium sp.]
MSEATVLAFPSRPSSETWKRICDAELSIQPDLQWAYWSLAQAIDLMSDEQRSQLVDRFDALDDKQTRGVRSPAEIAARNMAWFVQDARRAAKSTR